MKRRFLILAFCGLVSLPQTILADGRIFAQAQVDPVVLIPDQRALIHFEEGIERLVIETSYLGSGTNFAWVVPLPAKPKIEAASPEIFNALAAAFRPRLVHYVRPYWLVFLVNNAPMPHVSR